MSNQRKKCQRQSTDHSIKMTEGYVLCRTVHIIFVLVHSSMGGMCFIVSMMPIDTIVGTE